MLKTNRWFVLFLGILVSLFLLLIVPEEHLILRTFSVTMIAVFSIIYYLYRRYHLRLTLQSDWIIAANTLLQFLLPVFYLVFYFSNKPELDPHGYRFCYPLTSFAALLGQTIFFAGYESIKKSLYFPKVKVEQKLSNFFLVFLPFIFLVWVARGILLTHRTYYQLNYDPAFYSSPYYSLAGQMDLYGLLVIVALFLLVFSADTPKDRFKKIVAAVIFILLEIAWYLPSGRREPLLCVIIAPIVAYIFIRNRIPKKTVIILLITGFFTLTVLGLMRYVLPRYVNSQTTINFHALPQIAADTIKQIKEQKIDVVAETTDRFYDGKILGYLLAHYQHDYEFEMGESYGKIIYFFVPRFLYHDKPAFSSAFVSYKLVEWGSQPITFWGESYVNFSWPGIVMLSFILGLLMKGYDYLFITRAHKPFWLYLYVFSIIFIARLPVNSAAIWVSYLTKFIMMAFIFSWINSGLLRSFGKK